MIAQAADRHRDLACRVFGHRRVRYPRALGVCGDGWQQITDETYCRHCHRLLHRAVLHRFETGTPAPHLMDFQRRATKIPDRRKD